MYFLLIVSYRHVTMIISQFDAVDNMVRVKHFEAAARTFNRWSSLKSTKWRKSWHVFLQNLPFFPSEDFILEVKESFKSEASTVLFSCSSMVIRDLTLRSAASFGSFHLIRLLYDEYMFYLVEHRVAQATGETPIGVMGEVKTALLVEGKSHEVRLSL